jgi:hypothetical protein
MTKLSEAVERVAVDEAFDEALRAFHYETFRAGVCYERDEWPHTDEEWADLDRGIQNEAVGEHYEGWADDCIAKLTRTILSALTVDEEKVARAICEADCGRITENELSRCRDLARAAINTIGKE